MMGYNHVHTDIIKYKTKIQRSHDATTQLCRSTYKYNKQVLVHEFKALLPFGDYSY